MAFDHRLDSRHHMTRSGFSRRAFLRSSGVVIGGGLGLGLPARFRAPGHGWLPTVAAQSLFFDPVPDPIAAGWTKEGNEPYFPVGTSLRVTDTTNVGFVRFFVDASTLFAGEIELNPSVMVGSGFTVDADQYIGVHVAINDGDRQVKAALLGTEGGLRVALGLVWGYTRGFVLPTPTNAAFKIKRLTDGSGYLEVPGQPPEIIRRNDLRTSGRPGFQTLEFGSDGTGEVSTSEWFTLGLPPLAQTVAFASLYARADIRTATGNPFDMEALFTLGAASDGIDPLSETVTFSVGPREWRIGPGLFRRNPRGGFSYQGVVDGARLAVAITPLRQRGTYGFTVVGSGAEFGDMANPVPVSLRIGDDAGRTDVMARLMGVSRLSSPDAGRTPWS